MEEKSETGPGSCTVEEPDYCDNHGPAGYSVTAEETDVISASRDRPKKLKKKKHKKSSSSKRRRESGDVPLADDTDGETSDTPTSRLMKKTKSTRIKKKNPKEEGETERRQSGRKAKKKASKKLKKREKSSMRRSDTEHASSEALQCDSVPLDQDWGLYPDTTSNTCTVEPHDFPPDLRSDTSSSDLPYPGDLDHDFEYISDSTSSSVERNDTPPVSISSLLGANAPIKDHDEFEGPFLTSSLESMSRPPQSIPGSLAQEIFGDTLDLESAIEFSGGVRHKSRRWSIYWKPRAIVAAGVLFVVTIVMIVAL